MKVNSKEQKVNFNATKEEIISRLDRLANSNGQYDYETVPDEILELLLDCFGYASHHQGITRFQAGWIDLHFLCVSRGIEHGRMQDYSNLLYPQYEHNFGGWSSLISENKEWLASEASELIKKDDEDINRDLELGAHSEVRAHWELLVRLGKKND